MHSGRICRLLFRAITDFKPLVLLVIDVLLGVLFEARDREFCKMADNEELSERCNDNLFLLYSAFKLD